MEKRYQVFISSTLQDLKDERQSVLKAVLELDHMPAGMELFPAADESAWQLIKDVIDASDYYVLIIGGRYGSLDEAGIGYTEKEYLHAIETKKPVIPLLHLNPDNLPREKTETDESAWKKLIAFRARVEKRHTCVYWNSVEDLKAKVIVGLTQTVKKIPAIGWIRADKIPTEATVSELLSLRKRISELELEASASQANPPRGSEDLVQGDERVDITCYFTARVKTGTYPPHDDTTYSAKINPTWNQIFAAIAPGLINEASDRALRSSFKKFFTEQGFNQYTKDKRFKGATLRDFSFNDEDIDTCIVQFRALGLMTENKKQRSVKDTGTYWALTPYGDTVMVQLRAIRKKPLLDDVINSSEDEAKSDAAA